MLVGKGAVSQQPARPLRMTIKKAAMMFAAGLCLITQCQNNASKMMIGIGTPNNHSRIERISRTPLIDEGM